MTTGQNIHDRLAYLREKAEGKVKSILTNRFPELTQDELKTVAEHAVRVWWGTPITWRKKMLDMPHLMKCQGCDAHDLLIYHDMIGWVTGRGPDGNNYFFCDRDTETWSHRHGETVAFSVDMHKLVTLEDLESL